MEPVHLKHQTLFVMVGYPGAGKSYFARQFAKSIGGYHLSDNEIRYELFESPQYEKIEDDVVRRMMTYLLDKLLETGKSVVYDARVNRKSDRKKIQEYVKSRNIPVVAIWVQTDLETSFGRANSRDRRLTDDKYVPTMEFETFDKIQKQFQKPQFEDKLVISGKHLYSSQLASVRRRLDNAGLTIKPLPGSPKNVQLRGRVDNNRRRLNLR